MTNTGSFMNELKGLGKELAKALGEARKSKEYQSLERELVSGVKSVAAELKKSLGAAKQSKAAGRIKTRLNRVVKVGKAQGTVQAKKAQAEAAKRFKEATKAVETLRKRIKNKK